VCVYHRAVVRTRRKVSSTPAARSAHLANAALHQGSAAAAQHQSIYAGPGRTTDAYRVAKDARNVARYDAQSTTCSRHPIAADSDKKQIDGSTSVLR